MLTTLGTSLSNSVGKKGGELKEEEEEEVEKEVTSIDVTARRPLRSVTTDPSVRDDKIPETRHDNEIHVARDSTWLPATIVNAGRPPPRRAKKRCRFFAPFLASPLLAVVKPRS